MTDGGEGQRAAAPAAPEVPEKGSSRGSIASDPAPEPAAPGWLDRLGLRESAALIKDGLALLGRYWLPLAALAVAGAVAQILLARLAVAAGAFGAVPGFLALALVPLSSLLVLVAMLVKLRLGTGGSLRPWSLVAGMGSVLVAFLVVYESTGDLRADLLAYARSGAWADIGADREINRLPQIGSWVVIAVVLSALLVRAVGARVDKADYTGASVTVRTGRGAVRLLAGYAEAVWVTLGAWVLTSAIGNFWAWWSSRAAGRAVAMWWEDVREILPAGVEIAEWLWTAIAVIADSAVTALVVPISFLTIAVIVYGVQVADQVDEATVLRVVRAGRWRPLVGKLGDDAILLAWRRLSDPGSRFGALLGGVVLVLRSAFVPVLAYCVIYTLLTRLDIVTWWLARVVVEDRERMLWAGLYPLITGVTQMLVLVITVALTAVFASRLLDALGGRVPPESSAERELDDGGAR